MSTKRWLVVCRCLREGQTVKHCAIIQRAFYPIPADAAAELDTSCSTCSLQRGATLDSSFMGAAHDDSQVGKAIPRFADIAGEMQTITEVIDGKGAMMSRTTNLERLGKWMREQSRNRPTRPVEARLRVDRFGSYHVEMGLDGEGNIVHFEAIGSHRIRGTGSNFTEAIGRAVTDLNKEIAAIDERR